MPLNRSGFVSFGFVRDWWILHALCDIEEINWPIGKYAV